MLTARLSIRFARNETLQILPRKLREEIFARRNIRELEKTQDFWNQLSQKGQTWKFHGNKLSSVSHFWNFANLQSFKTNIQI